MRFLFVLLFPTIFFSQTNTDTGRFFSLLYLRGYSTKNRLEITFKEKYQGLVLINKDSINSEFSLINSYLIYDNNKIDLYDKNLKYFSLNSGNQILKVCRIPFDNELKRILLDTMNFSIYDTTLDFNLKNISKTNLIFKYNEKYYKIRRSIFRSFKEDLLITLDKIAIKDENLEKHILNFFIDRDML